MKFQRRLHTITVIVLSLLPLSISALPTDKSHKVEKLSFADRLSFRTNGTDWLLMIPNAGVEYDLRNTNWSRYAVNLNLRYRPGSNTLKICPFVDEVTEIKVEGRTYWRAKRRNTVFYRGVYASYGNGAFRISSDGQRGDFVQAGITWGFVKPLYAFSNGNSIDFEIGISGGIAFVKDEKFAVDEAANEYRTTSSNDWHLVNMPVVNDIHAALVYRLGRYPIQKKYRWREDVDQDYRDRKSDVALQRMNKKQERRRADSTYKAVLKYFRVTYDSVINVRHKERQEKIDKAAPSHKTYAKKKEGK